MTTQIVRWLAHGEPVPEGWRVLCDAPAHHGRHSRLIGEIGAKIPKTDRARGRQCVVESMPLREWLTVVEIAERFGRPVASVKTLVRRGWETGWLERRPVAGARGRYEYRRVK